jgi:hypothetical protein
LRNIGKKVMNEGQRENALEEERKKKDQNKE